MTYNVQTLSVQVHGNHSLFWFIPETASHIKWHVWTCVVKRCRCNETYRIPQLSLCECLLSVSFPGGALLIRLCSFLLCVNGVPIRKKKWNIRTVIRMLLHNNLGQIHFNLSCQCPVPIALCYWACENIMPKNDQPILHLKGSISAQMVIAII